jgi:hypothetical protein
MTPWKSGVSRWRRRGRTKKTSWEVERETRAAGEQTEGVWVSWTNYRYNSHGTLDGIIGNGEVYATKAHRLRPESEAEWEQRPGYPVSLVVDKGEHRAVCGVRFPYYENVVEFHEGAGVDGNGIPHAAPRGYCKKCIAIRNPR